MSKNVSLLSPLDENSDQCVSDLREPVIAAASELGIDVKALAVRVEALAGVVNGLVGVIEELAPAVKGLVVDVEESAPAVETDLPSVAEFLAGAIARGALKKSKASTVEIPPQTVIEGMFPLLVTPLEQIKSRLVLLDKSDSNVRLLLDLYYHPDVSGIAAREASVLRPLYLEFPAFSKVLDTLSCQLALRHADNGLTQFTPMLLVGPPGVGKSYFLQRLAETLGMPLTCRDMSAVGLSGVFCGQNPAFQSASAGAAFRAIFEGGHINPFLMVDELDKAQDTQRNPIQSLLGLLEKTTAARYTEEFLGVACDFSKINWVFTANTAEGLSDALLSRMRVFDIREPTREEMKTITEYIYSKFRASLNKPERFAKKLTAKALSNAAASGTPRDVRLAVEDAFAMAAFKGTGVRASYFGAVVPKLDVTVQAFKVGFEEAALTLRLPGTLPALEIEEYGESTHAIPRTTGVSTVVLGMKQIPSLLKMMPNIEPELVGFITGAHERAHCVAISLEKEDSFHSGWNEAVADTAALLVTVQEKGRSKAIKAALAWTAFRVSNVAANGKLHDTDHMTGHALGIATKYIQDNASLIEGLSPTELIRLAEHFADQHISVVLSAATGEPVKIRSVPRKGCDRVLSTR